MRVIVYLIVRNPWATPPPLDKQEYVLYILNHLEPEKSDFWCVNKVAFLVEFAFLYLKERELSNAHYAAIPHGPVLDDYAQVFEKMQKEGLIKIDGYKIRLVDSHTMNIDTEISEIITPRIKRYAQMTHGELKALTHAMDSYKITTDNEKVMGRRIDKSLAHLESFFEEDGCEEDVSDESFLPIDLDRSTMVKM